MCGEPESTPSRERQPLLARTGMRMTLRHDRSAHLAAALEFPTQTRPLLVDRAQPVFAVLVQRDAMALLLSHEAAPTDLARELIRARAEPLRVFLEHHHVTRVFEKAAHAALCARRQTVVIAPFRIAHECRGGQAHARAANAIGSARTSLCKAYMRSLAASSSAFEGGSFFLST